MYLYIDQFNTIPLNVGLILLIAGISLGIVLALYLLRSIGLYKLCKNNRLDKAFLAWIPFVWIYPACKLVKEFRFFGFSFDKFAIWATVIATFLELLTFGYNFICLFPLAGYYFSGGEIYFSSTPLLLSGWQPYAFPFPTFYCYVKRIIYPYNLTAINILLNIMNVLTMVLDLVVLVIKINLFVAIFRKFWPQYYIIASIASVFGLFPIFIFIIRNKVAISYADYLRSKGYTVYTQEDLRHNRKEDQPFSEFADKKDYDPGDPFENFSNKDDKYDN